MATRITQDQIVQINRMYKVKETYAAVARELGMSPATVKKYVDPDFEDITEDIPKIVLSLPTFEVAQFNVLTKRELFFLSDEEKEELKEVRKEILV